MCKYECGGRSKAFIFNHKKKKSSNSSILYSAIEQLKFIYTICLRKFLSNLFLHSRILTHGNLSGGREIKAVVISGKVLAPISMEVEAFLDVAFMH